MKFPAAACAGKWSRATATHRHDVIHRHQGEPLFGSIIRRPRSTTTSMVHCPPGTLPSALLSYSSITGPCPGHAPETPSRVTACHSGRSSRASAIEEGCILACPGPERTIDIDCGTMSAHRDLQDSGHSPGRQRQRGSVSEACLGNDGGKSTSADVCL